jgi:uncharacterized membrane protein YhaH (DUF805 family)
MDDIVTAVKTCLKKYADFNGRAARPEFWWFALFNFVATNVLGLIVAPLAGLLSLALLVPSLAVGARRLHDVNKSGWLQLLWLVPIIGWGLLIYWCVLPGDAATNQYGEPPVDSPVEKLA